MSRRWLPEKETVENGYLETNVDAITSYDPLYDLKCREIAQHPPENARKYTRLVVEGFAVGRTRSNK